MSARRYVHAAFVLTVLVSVQADVVCFKKYRKNADDCKRPVKRRTYTTPQECCSSKKGSGFAASKVRLRKKSFKCTSCEGLRSHQPTTEGPLTTTLPPWGEWGSCTATCGAGWRSKYRICDTCDANDYRMVRFEPCMLYSYCPVHGNWGPWHPWRQCSKTCDGGVRKRKRFCIYPPPAYGGENCRGDIEAIEECNMEPCPLDGDWSKWSEWSECNESCGTGSTRRTRRCDNPVPMYGGKNCRGPNQQTRKCENRRCPQNGGWSLWSSWSHCHVTCGLGFRLRTRECNSPKAQYGGKPCAGSSTDKLECRARRQCPVHGGWSPWSAFGDCRAPRCTGIRGVTFRSRTCTEPKPKFSGLTCEGSAYDRIECFNNVDCPVDGAWCPWSDWAPCSQSCKSESTAQARQRKCACPAPLFDGKDCEGPMEERRPCEDARECISVDGAWCSWSDWIPCLYSCDKNESTVKTRQRKCACPAPLFDGRDCEGPSKEPKMSCDHLHCSPAAASSTSPRNQSSFFYEKTTSQRLIHENYTTHNSNDTQPLTGQSWMEKTDDVTK